MGYRMQHKNRKSKNFQRMTLQCAGRCCGGPSLNSYWASYNNIYFPNFRNISGEEARAKKRGPELYSWQNSSRARIFRRDQHKVVDLSTMIHMMRLIFILC